MRAGAHSSAHEMVRLLSVNVSDYTTIHQSVFDDWYTNRE